MPEFDYEEFDRRQAEWEAQNRDAEDDDQPRNEQRPQGRFERAEKVDDDNDDNLELEDKADMVEPEPEDKDSVKPKDEDDVEW